MSIPRLSLLGLALAGLGICASAAALDENRRHFPRESKPLVLSEASARFIERAAQLDANDDGIIDAAEFASARQQRGRPHHAKANTEAEAKRPPISAERQARHAQMLEKRLAMFDTNRDGNVTTVEFVAAQEARLTRLDADGDGIVTAEEFRNARHGKRGPHGPRGERRGTR